MYWVDLIILIVFCVFSFFIYKRLIQVKSILNQKGFNIATEKIELIGDALKKFIEKSKKDDANINNINKRLLKMEEDIIDFYGFNFINIKSEGKGIIKQGEGILHSVSINNPSNKSNLMILYDDSNYSKHVIGEISLFVDKFYLYDIKFKNCLAYEIKDHTSCDITITYN